LYLSAGLLLELPLLLFFRGLFVSAKLSGENVPREEFFPVFVGNSKRRFFKKGHQIVKGNKPVLFGISRTQILSQEINL
jgi:hypothetical protein